MVRYYFPLEKPEGIRIRWYSGTIKFTITYWHEYEVFNIWLLIDLLNMSDGLRNF